MDTEQLREEIIRLGPWHFDIDVADGLSTRASLEAGSFQDIRAEHRVHLENLYPDGLQGRSVLDCACNSGGYLFWSRELGAGRCFGCDVREHWIRQARFVQQHRPDTHDMQFEVMDVAALADRALEPFDLTLFKGLFHRLPDPIGGLKIAADLTTEALILETNSRAGLSDDGSLWADEAAEAPVPGPQGLEWLPTGPGAVIRILAWAGFVDFHVMRWAREHEPGVGRFGMVASKRPGLLDSWKAKQVDARDRDPE